MKLVGSHIGTLIKPQSYRGALVISGQAENIHTLTEGIPLFIEIDGQRVPFFIEEISIDQSEKRAVIKFEFIDSIEQARRYTGCEVFSGHTAPVDTTENKLSRLIGFRLQDHISGKTYLVKEVIDQSENPLLILHSEQTAEDQTRVQQKEVMVPVRADFLLQINHKKKVIDAEFPEGLAE